MEERKAVTQLLHLWTTWMNENLLRHIKVLILSLSQGHGGQMGDTLDESLMLLLRCFGMLGQDTN